MSKQGVILNADPLLIQHFRFRRLERFVFIASFASFA